MRKLRLCIPAILVRTLTAVLLVISAAASALIASPGLAQAATWGTMKDGLGLCLDDTGYSTTAGTQMQVWTCNGKATQNWQIYQSRVQNGVIHYMFRVQQSAMCLDVFQQHGPDVVQWPCNTNDPAQWWGGVENANGGFQFQGANGSYLSAVGVPGDKVFTQAEDSVPNTGASDSWGLPPLA